MNDKVYIEKRHYDALLSAFGKLKLENAKLKDIVGTLKEKTQTYDDRVLDDIHQFSGEHKLDEERAYLIGAFNAMTAFRYDIEKMEEKVKC